MWNFCHSKLVQGKFMILNKATEFFCLYSYLFEYILKNLKVSSF